MKGKILITGGAGFLGRGIMRVAGLANWDARFTIYSRDEFKQHQCRDKYPQATYVLGDIRDTERLTLAMQGHDVVIHAAALKYVPEAEYNVNECVGINIEGTRSVISAARAARVRTVVGISTDKAVEPLNTYGLTKAIGERLFTEAARLADWPKFTMCRYGNVIGSTGSVLTVFKKQLEKPNRVITVTEPNMTRFWLPIDEAVRVVEIASDAGKGTIVIPNCKSTTIGEIARSLNPDIIETIGLRPGEKIHECLMTAHESERTYFDNMFGVKFGEYRPLMKVDANSTGSMTSDVAPNMPIEQFMSYARDAETV